jgi:hypothetical protein
LSYLVVCSGFSGKSKDSWDGDCQVVATDVVDLGLLNERPDVGLLEMVELVFVGGSEVGDHAAVVAGNDNTAFSSGLDFVDAVFSVHASGLAGLCQDIGVLVFADATNVDDRVLGEDVLDKLDDITAHSLTSCLPT